MYIERYTRAVFNFHTRPKSWVSIWKAEEQNASSAVSGILEPMCDQCIAPPSTAASVTQTRHIVQIFTVSIGRLISKCWWAFRMNLRIKTSSTQTQTTWHPRDFVLHLRLTGVPTYLRHDKDVLRRSKTGWNGWLLPILKGCLNEIQTLSIAESRVHRACRRT